MQQIKHHIILGGGSMSHHFGREEGFRYIQLTAPYSKGLLLLNDTNAMHTDLNH